MSEAIKKIYTSNEGYIALMSVLVLSVIGMAIITAALMLGANELQLGKVVGDAFQAQAVVQACAEEALQVVKDAGTCIDTAGELTIDSQTCTYTATGGGGSTCDVQAMGTVSEVSRFVHVTVTSSETGLALVSWEESIN